jgi:hypothetical protein
MRLVMATYLVLCSAGALAQSQSENPQAPKDAMGRPLQPDALGKADTTAPLTKPSPAASPQGETPPGNMAAPDGSSEPVKPKTEPQN